MEGLLKGVIELREPARGHEALEALEHPRCFCHPAKAGDNPIPNLV